MMKNYLCSIALALSLGVTIAHAQVATPDQPAKDPSAIGQSLQLQAADLAGKRFTPTAIQNKVSVVFFWSTACAVCRDSLPELRANLAGWRGKPFALVTVNVDRARDDWVGYENIASRTQMPANGLIALRQDARIPAPARLPLTLLVDNRGQVVARFEGRLAPEVWDGVAELLP